MENLSWDNFNEGITLREATERYKLRHGFYPESVHVDKIYRARGNILYCLERGIRISGPRLGRPPKEPDPAARKQNRQDALDRNCSEGKFGEGKRRYGLNLIKAKLQETSETVIMVNLIVMNLAHLYRGLFVFFKELFRVFKARFYCRRPGFARRSLVLKTWACAGSLNESCCIKILRCVMLLYEVSRAFTYPSLLLFMILSRVYIPRYIQNALDQIIANFFGPPFFRRRQSITVTSIPMVILGFVTGWPVFLSNIQIRSGCNIYLAVFHDIMCSFLNHILLIAGIIFNTFNKDISDREPFTYSPVKSFTVP